MVLVGDGYIVALVGDPQASNCRPCGVADLAAGLVLRLFGLRSSRRLLSRLGLCARLCDSRGLPSLCLEAAQGRPRLSEACIVGTGAGLPDGCPGVVGLHLSFTGGLG